MNSQIGWRYAVKNLNEINLYISMNDYEKTLDMIDQGIVNLDRLSQIHMQLDGIQSLSVFPEVGACKIKRIICSTKRTRLSTFC